MIMDNEEKTNKILKMVLAGLVGVAVVLVIILVVVLANKGGGGHVSFDSVKKYCESKGMEVTEDETTSGNMKGKYVACQTEINYSALLNGETADDYMSIAYAEFDRPVMEYGEFEEMKKELVSSGTVLKEDGSYLKLYAASGVTTGAASYLIIDGKTYMELMASSNDLAKEALVEMGYKNADWPE